MKDIIKLIATVISALVGAAIPLSCFYFMWSWCMAQIPASLAWAGLAKIGVTLGLVMVGGGITFALTILAATFVGGLVLTILD